MMAKISAIVLWSIAGLCALPTIGALGSEDYETFGLYLAATAVYFVAGVGVRLLGQIEKHLRPKDQEANRE